MHLGGIDLHQPFSIRFHQDPGSLQPRAVQNLDSLPVPGPPDLQVMQLVLVETYPLPRFPASPPD
jgi:hypothetical protein